MYLPLFHYHVNYSLNVIECDNVLFQFIDGLAIAANSAVVVVA